MVQVSGMLIRPILSKWEDFKARRLDNQTLKFEYHCFKYQLDTKYFLFGQKISGDVEVRFWGFESKAYIPQDKNKCVCVGLYVHPGNNFYSINKIDLSGYFCFGIFYFTSNGSFSQNGRVERLMF